MRPLPTSLLGCCLALSAACGEPNTAVDPVPVAYSVSGDEQVQFPGRQLVTSLTIQLIDDEGQSAQIGGFPVTWAILDGDGTLGREVDETGPIGQARTSWTLGPNVGTQRVEVTVGSFPPYIFTAEAVRPGPIAFLSNRRSGDPGDDGFRIMAGDVFVMDEDGSDVVQVSPQLIGWDWLSNPAWSSDGQQLAYVRSIVGINSGSIHVIESDGDDERRVAPNASASFTDPAWSPDNSRLVTWNGFSSGLWIVRVTSGFDYSRVYWQEPTVQEQDSRCPDWSPDGSKIVFECGVSGDGGICTVESDGSDVLHLTQGAADTDPAWSPDGGRILFARDTLAAGGIWLMSADGSELEQVLEGRGTNPSWSPDGTAFVVALADGSRSDIWKVNIATGEKVNLTQGIGVNWDPGWRW